ncbi:MAG: hypothetical protein JXA36_02355 [Coriobacteriia bacterium]|nr:hypothetical protein [Coriobacteriia bacterium]
MSFGTSDMYIYAYIAFAAVYLAASCAVVASAFRASAGLSRSHQTTTSQEPSPAVNVNAVVCHGQKIVDYTQFATLLPLVYIVGSIFLGSVITRDVSLTRVVNVGWVVFTVVCAVASVIFAALGIRESGAINHTVGIPADASGRSPEALQRIGVRLGISAALLLLVAVFTLLNLWSVVSSLETLTTMDFLL